MSGCFAILRQLRAIRRSEAQCRTRSSGLLSFLWSRRVSTLAGLPVHQCRRFQSVLNAAARLRHSTHRYQHVTTLLWDLRWLRSRERISFIVGVLVYRYLHHLAPPYTGCIAQTFNRFSNQLYRVNRHYLTDYFPVVVIAVSRQADKTDLPETSFPGCRQSPLVQLAILHHLCSTTRGLPDSFKTHLFSASFSDNSC